MIGDVASHRERSEAVGTLYVFSAVGMLVGPTVASLMLTLPFIGLRTIYQLDSVSQTFSLLYIVFKVEEPMKASKMADYRGRVAELFRGGGMVASIAMAALFFLYSAIMNTYVPIYGRKEVGLTDSQIASFSGYRNLAILLIRLSSITILSKLATTRFLTAVLVLGGVVGLASPYTNSYHGLTLLTLPRLKSGDSCSLRLHRH